LLIFANKQGFFKRKEMEGWREGEGAKNLQRNFLSSRNIGPAENLEKNFVAT
jgi:hypothetical protein